MNGICHSPREVLIRELCTSHSWLDKTEPKKNVIFLGFQNQILTAFDFGDTSLSATIYVRTC
uniref:Uncharacterized protein n=1 Tax=Candidatus Kentrum sp. LPFa TaxID=2126335 RepID=A0A450VS40_9GAMM|nr:MAG: hypothetical protein BECKLPF1236A_GA0070988_100103 [Candidatus Kentron sp. LPFa]